MNVVAKFPRTAAALFVLILLAPALPVAEATHVSEHRPDVPALPHAEPSHECVGLQVGPQVLARFLNPDGSVRPGPYLAEREGVPSVCDASGRPLADYQSLVRQLDAVLDHFRNVSAELQRQADQRLDYAYPDGPCVPGDRVAQASKGLTCGPLRPQFVVLEDRFDGRRLGGFGEWEVVTESGKAPLFHQAATATNNGTVHTWRFGDAQGYERGVHEFLVSPEIDLTAVRGEAFLVQQYVGAYQQARGALSSACAAPMSQLGGNPLTGYCGPGTSGDAIVRAYRQALDDHARGLPLGQAAATLDLTLRFNFAANEDGARVWLYVGDEAPSRVELFDLKNWGRGGGGRTCPGGPTYEAVAGGVRDTNDAADSIVCVESPPPGGARMLVPYSSSSEIKAFGDPNRAARADLDHGLTGHRGSFGTARVDLTDFLGKRVWLVVEVLTTPDTGRGGGYFDDAARFPVKRDYGLELSAVRVVGDAWPRNARVKDVGADLPRVPPENAWNDDPARVRALVPVGEDATSEPIVVRVHNAGTYVENVTVTLDVKERRFSGATPVGPFQPLPTPDPVVVEGVRPGEVREVRFAWPRAPVEGRLYLLAANLTVETSALPPVSEAASYAQPGVTAVRPPNSAALGQGGWTNATALVRAYTDHRLTPVRVSPDPGQPLEVCESWTPLSGCVELYAADKGVRRLLVMGVRNDGSVPEDARAVLHLALDGVERPGDLLGEAVLDLPDLLPGETRALQWAIAPAEPGVYEASVALLLPNGSAAGDLVTRLLYVQRSTGLVCYDNLADDRACGPSFQLEPTGDLANQDVTAVLVADDGTTYAATAVTRDGGALVVRGEDGRWTTLANLSSGWLEARYGTPRRDVTYGPIRDMAFGPEGAIWMVGDNATVLEYRPGAEVRAVGHWQPPPAPLAAHAGGEDVTVHPGRPAPLSGGASGGVPPYAYEWTVTQAPAGSAAPVLLGEGSAAALTPDLVGDYRVMLKVADAQDAVAFDNTTVRVVPAPPECVVDDDGRVLRGSLVHEDAAGDAEGATDVLCVRAENSPHQGASLNQAGRLEVRLDLAAPLAGLAEARNYSVGFTVEQDGPPAASQRFHVRVTVEPGRDPVARLYRVDGSGVEEAVGGANPQARAEGATLRILVDRFFLKPATGDGGFTHEADVLDFVANVTRNNSWVDLDRAPDEGGATWRFDRPGAPARVEGLAVTANRDDGHKLFLKWEPTPGAVSYLVERAFQPQGPWAQRAERSAADHVDPRDGKPIFTDDGLAAGTAAHYRVRAVSDDGSAGRASRVASGMALEPRPDLRAVGVVNGTVWAAGIRGALYWHNETSQRMDQVNLTVTGADGKPTAYAGDFHDALLHDGRLWLAGNAAAVFVNDGNRWNETWTPNVDGGRGYGLRALYALDGRVHAAGTQGVLLRADGTGGFDALAGLPQSWTTDRAAVAGDEGPVVLVASGGRFAVCDPCGAALGWSFPVAPIPTVSPSGEAPRRARLLDAASGGGVTLVVGEGALVLDFADRGLYDNRLDWSVEPVLEARDGGVVMASPARPDDYGPWRWVPDASASAQDLAGWTELRLRVRHHLGAVPPGVAASMRVFYEPYPSTSPNTQNPPSTCPSSAGSSGASNNPLRSVCSTLTLVLWSKEFTTRTAVSGWETIDVSIPPPRQGLGDGGPGVQGGAGIFSGVEFWREPKVMWAIDEFEVQGLYPDGQWRTLAAFYNETSPKNVGERATYLPATRETSVNAWIYAPYPFHMEPESAWHISTDLADSPVWVANDEVHSVRPGGAKPRLRDNLDTRLVSPAIDLGDAYDPVIGFSHQYAFRMLAGNVFGVPDGGVVEVQYEMRGKDCGSSDPEATCWSRFFPVCPERPGAEAIFNRTGGVYCPAGTGYPDAEEVLGTDATLSDTPSDGDDNLGNPFGPYTSGTHRVDVGRTLDRSSWSYWGRSVRPNEERVIEDVRYTDDYLPVEIHLSKQTQVVDPRGETVNLSGKRIRVAFHLHTIDGDDATSHENAPVYTQFDPNHDNQGKSPTTFPREGWYIKDFKVRGAAALGLDLRATNLSFRVGYDVGAIGVGPGTRVPVNVTVENRGVFEASGYEGALEVRRVDDAVAGLTTLVGRVTLAQQPALAPGASRNHTLLWDVPGGEHANYTLRFVAEPAGLPDEDPTDNAARLGSMGRPVAARTVRDFEVRFAVAPENATADITRYVPIFLDNTGNVDLEGFTVTRRITTLKGPLTTVENETQWRTQRAVPAGTRAALHAISDEVDVATDLFWKPGERSTFRFEIFGTVPGNASSADGAGVIARSADSRIAAFATYLFDDAEAGPRGESTKGEWAFDPGWGPVEPGFRSSDSYGFGDPLLVRYPGDADASAVTPVVDLSGARSARLSIYHKHQFEAGYDGGVVEASADGGKTWHRLAPVADALNRLPKGYNGTPMSAVSPLHETKDPRDATLAFTGDSSMLPESIDGWYVSVFDLTEFRNVTETQVPYELYDASALAGYGGPGKKATDDYPSAAAGNAYVDGSWGVGPVNEHRYWEVQNLTEGALVPRVGDTLWWSGSMSLADDGVRPVNNTFLKVSFDDGDLFGSVSPGDRVYVEWWEWVDRYRQAVDVIEGNADPEDSKPSEEEVRGVVLFHDGAPSHNYRFNVTRPSVVEKDGRWMLMRADVTEWASDRELPLRDVVFAYTPAKKALDAAAYPNWNSDGPDNVRREAEKDPERYLGWQQDRGFVIDGFRVWKARTIGGQETAPVVLMDEDAAWRSARVEECRDPAEPNRGNDPNPIFLPCFGAGAGGRILHREAVAPEHGRTWSLARDVPGVPAMWDVVPVRDEDDRNDVNKLPIGIAPNAWYTGDLCRAPQTLKVDAKATGGSDKRLEDAARPFLAAGVRPGDEVVFWKGAGAGQRARIATVTANALTFDAPLAVPVDGTTRYVIPQASCLRPGEETRLVTPAFDLGLVAGQTAELRFTHRFAFHTAQNPGDDHPLASGGAVEIQVFDPQTGEWGPWKQLFPDPDALGRPLTGKRDEARRGPFYGGYTAYTTNATLTASGGLARADMPFEVHRECDQRGQCEEHQYLYSGASWSLGDDWKNGWLHETFDLKEHLGERVRIGFHVALSGEETSADRHKVWNPLEVNPAQNTSAIGWWIKDLAVVGDVLNGGPVQLRLRAATDGNVHDGTWLVDDVGVFGSRYGRNVGVFVDQAPGAFGVTQANSTLVPLTLRNLGDTVRHDLGLEVRRLAGPRVELNGTVDGKTTRFDVDHVLLTGNDLAPGQTLTVLLNVTAPSLVLQDDEALLQILLKEWNADVGRFVNVTDNEVQGFLRRDLEVVVQRQPDILIGVPRVVAAGAQPGEPVEALVDVENLGYAPVALDLACRAETLAGHDPRDHRRDPSDGLRLRDAGACDLVAGETELPPRGRATLTFRAAPPEPGFVRFAVNGSFTVGDAVVKRDAPVVATVAVGRAPVLLQDAFAPDPPVPGRREDPHQDARDNDNVRLRWWPYAEGRLGSVSRPLWSALRGHAEPGALLLGMDEATTRQDGADYSQLGCGAHCAAVSRPIDLHNFTDEKVVLSFRHMARFAEWDGGRVLAQVLLDESRPEQSTAWSYPCVLQPEPGYDGAIKSTLGQASTPGQPSEGTGPDPIGDMGEWNATGFTSFRGWDESWRHVRVDLTQPCKEETDIDAKTYGLVGRTVRVVFESFHGSPAMSLTRGLGHGWLIDDVSVGLVAIDLAPAAQEAQLLDNTTKGFHVLLRNLGDYPDLVRLDFDPGNSSAPAGSVVPPAEPVALAPGETKLVRVDVTLPRDPSLLPTQFTARVAATSLLDRFSTDAADFKLLFAPRQWPELAVSASVPRQVVQEGTEVFLPITVENTGLVESVPTKVRVTDRWAGGEQVYELDLPAVPSWFQASDDATRVLEFRWKPARGSVGLHTLLVEADPQRLSEEYTRDNNVLALEVPVSELLLPDLDVSAADVLRVRDAVGRVLEPEREADVSRYEATAGELVTLEVRLRNSGKAGATNVDVRAFIGPLSLPPRVVPYVAPGSEVALTFNWLAQKGEYPVEVVARTEQVELTNANNHHPAQGVTLLVVKGFEVQVALPPVEGVLEPGTEIKVPFNLTNSGEAGEEIDLVVDAPAGVDLELPRTALFLRAGETYQATATLVIGADAVAGEQFITVEAIARENPMKASAASTPVRVRAFYGGSVQAAQVVASPPTLAVPVTLVNEGNSLEPWTVTAQLPAGWTAQETLPAKVVVPAHGEATLTLHVRVPETTAPGPRTFAAKAVMPDGEAREATLIVDVRELRAASVKVAAEAPKAARGALAYPVTVENAGNVEAPFEMVLLGQPEGVEVTVEPSVFTLPPGGKTIATLVVTPVQDVPSGTVQLSAYTVFAGVSPDTAEGRANLQRLQIDIQRPELRVAPLEFAPRVDVRAGERVVVKVPVSNDGQTRVDDVPVHLYVDDVFVAEARIPSLAPGETHEATLNWTATPGEHAFTVVVDPYEDAVDLAREDNAVSDLVEVGSGPVRGVAGGALVPAPGLAGLLVALLAAVAVAAFPDRRSRRPPR